VSDADRIQQLEAQLRNTEHQLTAYRDKIDKDDLIRCLRAARDSYRSETIRLKDQIADLEQQNDGLRDDNMNLSAMTKGAYKRMFELQRAKRERARTLPTCAMPVSYEEAAA
jgi:chromosome segregation ATPase